MVWCILIGLCLAQGVLAVSGASSATGGFERYGVILERAPFGRPPAVSPESASPVAPGESFATYIRLTAMVRGEDGVIRLGFVNKREKDQTFVVAVGERLDDFEVMEADMEHELARVRKGNEIQWLSLRTVGPAQPPPGWVESGGGSGVPMVSAVPVVPPLPAATPVGDRRQSRYAAIRRAQLDQERLQEERRRQAQLAAVVRPPPPDDEDEDDDMEAEARAIRIAQANRQLVDAEEDEEETVISVPLPGDGDEDDGGDVEGEDEEIALREAEIQAHLQRYQMELIRKGLPPLPIRLTPENDAALVQEGFLPPLPEEGPTGETEGDQE